MFKYNVVNYVLKIFCVTQRWTKLTYQNDAWKKSFCFFKGFRWILLLKAPWWSGSCWSLSGESNPASAASDRCCGGGWLAASLFSVVTCRLLQVNYQQRLSLRRVRHGGTEYFWKENRKHFVGREAVNSRVSFVQHCGLRWRVAAQTDHLSALSALRNFRNEPVVSERQIWQTCFLWFESSIQEVWRFLRDR